MFMPFLGLSLASSNIKKDNLNIIKNLVSCFINPLIITFIGILLLLGLKNGVYKNAITNLNIPLFSINFFVVNVALAIILKRIKFIKGDTNA
jgi:uncharacterized membrane protein YccF (DUF307 family)